MLQLYSIHNVYKVVEARKGSMVLALAMVISKFISFFSTVVILFRSSDILHLCQLFPFGLLLAGVLVW